MMFFFFKQKTAYEMRISDWSSDVCSSDLTGGSSLNLRGAGADATLTLLNGRPRSYGGLYDSVDISAIPVEAVDRIEIVAEGASAIYGSDANAGVGTVLLRRAFERGLLGATYGQNARKSVVWGKGLSGRVRLGGHRYSTKK